MATIRSGESGLLYILAYIKYSYSSRGNHSRPAVSGGLTGAPLLCFNVFVGAVEALRTRWWVDTPTWELVHQRTLATEYGRKRPDKRMDTPTWGSFHRTADQQHQIPGVRDPMGRVRNPLLTIHPWLWFNGTTAGQMALGGGPQPPHPRPEKSGNITGTTTRHHVEGGIRPERRHHEHHQYRRCPDPCQ